MLNITLISAQEKPNWEVELGFGVFKSSLNYQPNEIAFNPVFSKWERINQQPDLYDVNDYQALQSYAFDLNIQADAMFKYKKYFMIKLSYIYSNTLGIGGTGNIAYEEISSGVMHSESKEINYSSHQFNWFIGPNIPIGEAGPDIFMGFSMMSPTLVSYNEEFTKSENGIFTRDYNMKFSGFFGNCRMLLGMQVPIGERWKLGSEMVYSFFNGVKLKSGDITDNSFKFPEMRWFFTIRYKIK